MTFRISQTIDHTAQNADVLVEGILTQAEAKLLENICTDLMDRVQSNITINVSGVTIQDDGAKELLHRIKDRCTSLTRCSFFPRNLIEDFHNGEFQPCY
ncbi:MAG TPA: hypothetical protein PLB18_16520 [Acidobacteriota bacterium]|nr:hypothetical protein [Acidobacteriota bacterium]HNC42814.1 hypothetical protein [Acidobacteriota bacterium]HND20979.1 hypothetical protein [Acidobacteriota bacterium]HNG94043.1 hypothetical protein [Acidobacteriota bacterium]HNJ43500.1 hypothetical protein [Acidobacteriota bacterium]